MTQITLPRAVVEQVVSELIAGTGSIDHINNLLTELTNALQAPATPPVGQAAAEPPKPQFPTVLRKMWSGGEVQEWIDRNWPKPPASTS